MSKPELSHKTQLPFYPRCLDAAAKGADNVGVEGPRSRASKDVAKVAIEIAGDAAICIIGDSFGENTAGTSVELDLPCAKTKTDTIRVLAEAERLGITAQGGHGPDKD